MKRLITYCSKKSLSLENGSGMTREWLGIASARPFTVLVLFLMLFSFGIGNAWASDSGLSASAGTFVLDFYDDTKLNSTSGTNLTSDNYTNFLKVYGGLTKSNVVTGVTTSGNNTARYGMNGGLTIGTNSNNANSVTFSLGTNFPVRKATVYAATYETGRWKLAGNAAGNQATATYSNKYGSISSSPLVWNNLSLTSLAFTKDNGSGSNQKRLTIHTIVCEYGYRAYLTTPAEGSISAAPKTANENGAGWNSDTLAVMGLKSGQKVTLSATPPSGKVFDSWTVKKKSDNSDITASVLDGNEITMPAYDVVVSVTWRSAGCSNYSFLFVDTDLKAAKSL